MNLPGLAGNALVVGYDGKSGWTSSPQGTQDIPPSQFGEFIRRILLTGGIGLYQAAQAGTVQVQAIGQRDFQGLKADAVADCLRQRSCRHLLRSGYASRRRRALSAGYAAGRGGND